MLHNINNARAIAERRARFQTRRRIAKIVIGLTVLLTIRVFGWPAESLVSFYTIWMTMATTIICGYMGIVAVDDYKNKITEQLQQATTSDSDKPDADCTGN